MVRNQEGYVSTYTMGFLRTHLHFQGRIFINFIFFFRYANVL